jgi:hypothetical protein
MSPEQLLRRACRRLTPASLRPAGQIRRLTFLTGLQRRRGELFVVLSPLGGEPCVGRWATVDFALDGQEATATGTIVAHVGSEATLRLRRPPALRPPRRRRARPPAGTTVAVHVPEGTGLGRLRHPVLDVGARALRLASSVPLQTGVTLGQLTILHREQVVRRAEGTVVRCEPVVEPSGRTSYQLGVRVRAAPAASLADDPADVAEITDPARVRSIVWGLCDLGHPVTLRAGSETVACRLTPVRGSRDALPEMRGRMEREAPLTGPVQLECVLFGSGYRLYARVRRREGTTLWLAPAPVVREWHRREEERVALAPEVGARVRFRHPLDGAPREHVVLDLSPQGFSFAREPEDDVFWSGLPLEDVVLELPGSRVQPVRVSIRTVGERRCGARMEVPSPRERDRLRAELVRRASFPVELHDGEDLDGVLELHRAVRLLEPDMARNLEQMLPEMRRTWRAGHQHPDGLMRTAIVRWKGAVGATATLVRAYDTSWALQHLAVRSAAVPANPGMLHGALMQLVGARPDCEYVFTFVAGDARSLHATGESFLTSWSTPEHRGASPFVLYSGATRPPGPRPRGVRRLGPDEEPLVVHAALRLMDPVCVRALGLREGHIRLRDTSAAYRRAGLARGREAYALFDRGAPMAVLLREWASPGLSLSSLLDAGIYLPITPDPEGRAAAALVQVLLSAPLPGDPLVRFLFVPGAPEEAPLLAAGLHRVAGSVLYAFQGLGLQEYQRYVATRYGLLHGRLRARVSEAA